MSDTSKPVGYGHDHKGAAGGAAVGDGKPGVAHTAPADKSPARAKGRRPTPSSSTTGRSTSARARRSSAPARRLGIKLPHLCYSPKPGYRPDGNCRVCMVEIEGERVLAASCIRTPTPGMKVKTADRPRQDRAPMVAELLITDQPDACAVAHDPDSELWKIAERA